MWEMITCFTGEYQRLWERSSCFSHHIRLKEKTYSLWPFLLDDQKKYLNPLYSSQSQKSAVLEPNTVSFNFK